MKDVRYLGWNYETKDGRAVHDKIWGVIRIDGQMITFWGRRGASLTFKKPPEGDIDKLITSKKKKGYRETSMDELEREEAGFEDHFDEQIILAQLGNFFHRINE